MCQLQILNMINDSKPLQKQYSQTVCWTNVIANAAFYPMLVLSHPWVNIFTAKVDRGRFMYLHFNLTESTLVDLKFTLLVCLK
jgi:ABC-type sulfate transport system permease subunit